MCKLSIFCKIFFYENLFYYRENKTLVAPYFASSALVQMTSKEPFEITNVIDLDYAMLHKGVNTGEWDIPKLAPNQTEVIAVLEAPLFPPVEGTVTRYVDA